MAIARGSRIALDTNILSYLLDETADFHSAAVRVIRETGQSSLSASVLALSEILVRAYRQGGTPTARRVRMTIESIAELTLIPIGPDIAQLAASFRARSRLALPDALHLASASASDADVFLTNDAGFKALGFGVQVILLSEA